MIHHTTIEINEVETEISVIYRAKFGTVTIEQITEIATGDAICPDLFEGLITPTALNALYEDLAEAADEERIPCENSYDNAY